MTVHPDWSYVQRRHDSDLEGMKYRLYEMSGAAVGSSYDRRIIPCNEDIIKCGVRAHLWMFQSADIFQMVRSK